MNYVTSFNDLLNQASTQLNSISVFNTYEEVEQVYNYLLDEEEGGGLIADSAMKAYQDSLNAIDQNTEWNKKTIKESRARIRELNEDIKDLRQRIRNGGLDEKEEKKIKRKLYIAQTEKKECLQDIEAIEATIQYDLGSYDKVAASNAQLLHPLQYDQIRQRLTGSPETEKEAAVEALKDVIKRTLVEMDSGEDDPFAIAFGKATSIGQKNHDEALRLAELIRKSNKKLNMLWGNAINPYLTLDDEDIALFNKLLGDDEKAHFTNQNYLWDVDEGTRLENYKKAYSAAIPQFIITDTDKFDKKGKLDMDLENLE